MKDFAKSIKVVNANYRYKGYLITKSDEDGEIIVYKPNGRDVAFRGTKSESIAKDWCDHHEVGNADNWHSYDEMIKKAKHDLEVIKQKEREAISFSKKQELASARREIEDKLKYYQKQTGNIKDDAKAKELHKKMMDAKEIAEEWGRASNYQKKDNLEGGRKAAEDAYWKAKKEYEDYAMNSKTGAEEFFKQLSDDVKEREKKDDADIEKVGNAKDNHGKELKVGDKVDVSGKKGKITKIIGADVVEVFFDNSGTDYPDRIDRYYDSEVVKVGNAVSDDKFAYVMREFDEGKLKTPDGKVVTDPAQAKAIAYSESKKTENGLVRAINAMNKKNPDGLRLKIQDYAGQGLAYQDIVNQLIRFGYDKSDIEAQKEYIKSLIKE